MSLLVIGSNGFLGRAVTDVLRRQDGLKVYGTHRHRAAFSGSLTYDFWHDDLTPLLERTGADTVILIAAVEPDAQTPQLIGRAEHFFRACGACHLVYLSSDAVFDGTKGNYRESDIPSPVTPYGRNLEMLERTIRTTCEGACIIRPSYLYGFSLGTLDHRLFRTRQRLLSGEIVHYAEDMFKSPMDVTLAAEAISKLVLQRHSGTVHISGARTSLYAFYHDAMRALGVPPRLYVPTQAACRHLPPYRATPPLTQGPCISLRAFPSSAWGRCSRKRQSAVSRTLAGITSRPSPRRLGASRPTSVSA